VSLLSKTYTLTHTFSLYKVWHFCSRIICFTWIFSPVESSYVKDAFTTTNSYSFLCYLKRSMTGSIESCHCLTMSFNLFLVIDYWSNFSCVLSTLHKVPLCVTTDDDEFSSSFIFLTARKVSLMTLHTCTYTYTCILTLQINSYSYSDKRLQRLLISLRVNSESFHFSQNHLVV